MVLLKSGSKITDNTMLYNTLFTYEDKKDGKLVIRCKIPDNVFHLIEELNNYLSRFGRYRVDSFWFAKSKVLAYDFKTTLPYKKYIEKSQRSD